MDRQAFWELESCMDRRASLAMTATDRLRRPFIAIARRAAPWRSIQPRVTKRKSHLPLINNFGMLPVWIARSDAHDERSHGG